MKEAVVKGKESEVERIRKVIASGRLCRVTSDAASGSGECDRFEAAWGRHLAVAHVRLASSGTAALYAALIGLGVGPGDQVVIPAYGSISTALAVLKVGAIPVIADVDESLTLSPEDLERRLTKRTRAVIPVHALGLPCDMSRIVAVARKHRLLVVEDVRQALGGGYHGKQLGTFGHAGVFDFGARGHLSCGEGGVLVTDRPEVHEAASGVVDFERESPDREGGGVGDHLRASELQGAMLFSQLRRLDGALARQRTRAQALYDAGMEVGLRTMVRHSGEEECGLHVGFAFDDENSAGQLSAALRRRRVNAFRPSPDCPRELVTGWEPVMMRRASHHRDLDPFQFKSNRKCRIEYHSDMYGRTLDILSRIVVVTVTREATKELDAADSIRSAMAETGLSAGPGRGSEEIG